jgi:hypothetical protein
MIKKLTYRWRSMRKVKTAKKAEDMGLTWVVNIYGDRINHLDCRSIWVDEYDNAYRCDQLYTEELVDQEIAQ